MIKIEADLHTHTLSSGHAYSTMDELARAAADKALELIAITDHGPNMPGGPHEYYFGNLKVVPDKIHGVRILKGIEANILEDGKLDLAEDLLDSLDFVAAGLHADTGHSLVSKEDYTEATVKAIQNPYVDMITHPANLKFPIDFTEVVKAASENEVLIEINASSFHKDKIGKRGDVEKSVKLARLAKKCGVLLSLNTDTHYHTQVGDISSLDYIIKKADLRSKHVINTSWEWVMNFLYYQNPDGKRKIISV